MSYYDYDEDYDIFEDYDFGDNVKKKKGKGKTIAVILASVLAIAAVFGVGAMLFKQKEEAELKFIQKGLEMQDTLKLQLGSSPGVYFTATVSPELKKEVESDESKSFGFAVLNTNGFEKIGKKSSSKKIDWVKSFEDAGETVVSIDDCEVLSKSQSDGSVIEYYIQGDVTSFLYQNTNTEFVAIAYVKTTDEDDEVSYKYSNYTDVESYKTRGRSLAYLVAEALNENAVNKTYYSSADLNYMKGVINNSVDAANDLENATNDGSMYEVTLSKTKLTMELGKETTLKTEIEEDVKVPVWWTTGNASIVTVKNGVLKATGVGETTVSAWVAGVEHTCTVTVEED